MTIIKLSATNSTNDYLKALTSSRHVENFTIVTTDFQNAGRGQMGARWEAEPFKNLTFSVLIKDLLLAVNDIFTLNVATAVSIYEAMQSFNIPGLSIKWANDILAGNKKIGGILIENIIKNDGEIFSVIGIGLNVNQTEFKKLPKASSMAALTGREYDRDAVLIAIAENLKRNMSRILNKDIETLWAKYHKNLFKKDVPMPFESTGNKFMGIITGVTRNGSLMLQLEDDSIKEFKIKEIQMLY